MVSEWDEEISEWLLTPESLQQIDDTKARRMGLLLPAELKALRERLCLSQSQIADMLEIGEKSWSRWESGRHRPSRSMNLLIKTLDAGVLETIRERPERKQQEWSFLHLCLGQHKSRPTLGQTIECQADIYAPSYAADEDVYEEELEALVA